MDYKKLLKIGLMIAISTIAIVTQASDHDDGEADLKGRALNLTDVYVFREDKEIAAGSANHLVFIINSNPRSLPQQQYYFSTKARYELKIARVGTSKDVASKTAEDITLRLEFGVPDSSGVQKITLTKIENGQKTVHTQAIGGADISTTALASALSPLVSNVNVDGETLSVFAGLRKDPFFFDVTAFFKFRAAAAGTGGALPVPGFAAFPVYTPNGLAASDFTAEYNANTIALRIPIALLQSAAAETVFDSWATVSVPK